MISPTTLLVAGADGLSLAPTAGLLAATRGPPSVAGLDVRASLRPSFWRRLSLLAGVPSVAAITGDATPGTLTQGLPAGLVGNWLIGVGVRGTSAPPRPSALTRSSMHAPSCSRGESFCRTVGGSAVAVWVMARVVVLAGVLCRGRSRARRFSRLCVASSSPRALDRSACARWSKASLALFASLTWPLARKAASRRRSPALHRASTPPCTCDPDNLSADEAAEEPAELSCARGSTSTSRSWPDRGDE